MWEKVILCSNNNNNKKIGAIKNDKMIVVGTGHSPVTMGKKIVFNKHSVRANFIAVRLSCSQLCEA